MYKFFLLLLLLLSLDLSLLVLSACQMAQQRGIDSLANVTLNHFVNTRWAKGETENGWWVGYSCRKHVRKVYILNFKGSSHVTACFLGFFFLRTNKYSLWLSCFRDIMEKSLKSIVLKKTRLMFQFCLKPLRTALTFNCCIFKTKRLRIFKSHFITVLSTC